ncbi:Alkaline phosphatase synthesis sensor protein PhoR [compost metagenome]
MKSLYISSIASAYKLWVNGQLVAVNGKVGTSKEEMIPQNYAKIATFHLSQKQAEVVIQVSNYVQRKGGLWTSIGLGSPESISYQRDYRTATTAAITACLLAIGIYHCLLYILRRKDKLLLYFGAFCMLIALRALFLGEVLAVRLFPQLPWEMGVKMEYLGIAIGLPLFTAFVHALYPNELKRKYLDVITVTGAGYSLLIILTPASWFTMTMQLAQFIIVICFIYISYCFVLAVHRQRKRALLNLAACTFLLVAGVNDILYYNHWVPNGELFPLGLLLSTFTLAYMLSVRSSHSYMQVEQLSYQLTRLNDSLESKIEERTIDLQTVNQSLQIANSELASMEQSRRRLMSSISHELGTPLTSIKGYMEAIMEGVIQADDPKYIRLIYDKTLYLERMIADLFELSRLEAKQIRFDLQTMSIEEFAYNLYEKYELDIQTSGIQVEWHPEICPIMEGIPVAQIDPVRLEQVYMNFLMNALKFTPEGGTIKVGIRWTVMEDTNLTLATVYVTDSGVGILEEDLPFIFERFYKGRNMHRPYNGGSGLGLAISKEIMEAHNGSVGVKSKPGEGSTFTFSLQVTSFNPMEV